MPGEEGSWQTSRVKEHGEFSETAGKGGQAVTVLCPKGPLSGRLHNCPLVGGKLGLWKPAQCRGPGPFQGARGSHLVIPLTQELEPLSSFVHEDPVQVACLHGADLDGFFAPAHYLVGADVGWRRREWRGCEWAAAQAYSKASLGPCSLSTTLTHRGGHLSPLQHHILNDPPIRVDIHALVLVAQQHLHAIGVGEEDDGMGCDLALDLRRRWARVPESGAQTGGFPLPTVPPGLHEQGCRCHSCSLSRHPQRGSRHWSRR